MGTNWMNDETTEDYLKRTFGTSTLFKSLLVWDSFRCHISDSTKTILKQLKLDTAIVPRGTTEMIQPADVSWNAPFKRFIQEYFDE